MARSTSSAYAGQRAADPEPSLALIERVLAGEPGAWRELVRRAHPALLRICRMRRFVGGFSDPEDTRRDVAVRALERIRANDFAALRAFALKAREQPGSSFVRWLAVIAATCYADYLRAQPEYQRRRDRATRQLTRLRRGPLGDGASEGSDPLAALEVRRILDCVMNERFPPEQRVAVVMWLQGNSASEIARELGLGEARGAHRLLHAARQRLRRAVHGGTP